MGSRLKGFARVRGGEWGLGNRGPRRNQVLVFFSEVFLVRTNAVFSFLALRIRVVGPTDDDKRVAGPSKPSKAEKKRASKGKGKVSEVRASEGVEGSEEERAICRAHIAATIARKRVEIEMNFREIEVLEELLEEY
jgi:hypothetical protein